MKSILDIDSNKTKNKVFNWIVMIIIFINSIIIYLDVSNIHSSWLTHLDTLCSLFFVGEMLFKIRKYHWKGYWEKGWNKFDGLMVILSLPSIMASFMPITDMSLLLMLRALRILRIIYFVKGDAEKIGQNFLIALRKSSSLFVGYFIVICIFALLSTSLFGQAAPQYFGTPMDSIYSIFKLFTIEGWYDIPDALANSFGTWGVILTRLLFCLFAHSWWHHWSLPYQLCLRGRYGQ